MGELENLDGYETALLLIDSGAGTVTRYGVVYDNGMRLEQLYDGKHLPDYHYEPDLLTVALTSMQEQKDTEQVTWLYLPAAKGQIERAMFRSGIQDPEDMPVGGKSGSIRVFPQCPNACGIRQVHDPTVWTL